MLKERRFTSPPSQTPRAGPSDLSHFLEPILESSATVKTQAEDVLVIKRVSYQSKLPLGALALLTFTEPEQRVALLEEQFLRELTEAPAATALITRAESDFDCICLNASTASTEAIKRALEWMDPDGSSAANASVKIEISGDWIRTKPGRVIIYSMKDAWRGHLSALADFNYQESQLRKLELEVAADWGRVETDLPLANDVKTSDLKRLDEIGTMTKSVWRRRIRLSRLERSLAKCAVPLPKSASKLAARLRLKFDVAERAAALSSKIEVYEYIYEMANQRMGEYSNFRHGYLIEVLIVVLLAGELAIMIFEFTLHHFMRAAG